MKVQTTVKLLEPCHQCSAEDMFVRLMERKRAELMVNCASPKPLVHLVQNIYLYAHQDGRTFTIYIQRDKQDHTHDTCTCSLMFYKIKTALLTHQVLISNEP